MSKKLMEMSTIEGRVRYLSQFIGGLNGLAARIGISPRQLSNYMGGKLNWPPHRIAALAAATKTDPEWIIHGSGEAPRPERLLGIRMAAIADAKPLGIRQLSAAMNSERATEVRAVIQQVATRISAALQSQADLSALSGTMPWSRHTPRVWPSPARLTWRSWLIASASTRHGCWAHRAKPYWPSASTHMDVPN